MAIDWLAGSTASIFEGMRDTAMPFVEESAAAELMSGASRFAPDAGVFGLLSAADHYSDVFHMAARAPAVLAGLFSGMSLGASDEFVQSANNVGLGLSTLWTPGGSESNVEAVKIQTLPVDSTFNGPSALTTPVLDESARHQTTSFLPTNLLGLNRTQGGHAPLDLPTAMYSEADDNPSAHGDQTIVTTVLLPGLGQKYTKVTVPQGARVLGLTSNPGNLSGSTNRLLIWAKPLAPLESRTFLVNSSAEELPAGFRYVGSVPYERGAPDHLFEPTLNIGESADGLWVRHFYGDAPEAGVSARTVQLPQGAAILELNAFKWYQGGLALMDRNRPTESRHLVGYRPGDILPGNIGAYLGIQPEGESHIFEQAPGSGDAASTVQLLQIPLEGQGLEKQALLPVDSKILRVLPGHNVLAVGDPAKTLETRTIGQYPTGQLTPAEPMTFLNSLGNGTLTHAFELVTRKK